MGASGNHRAVHLINIYANLRGGTRCDLLDMLNSMLLVAWVDALGAVAAIKVHIEFESRNFFNYRYALFLGHTRIDC